jgi:acetyl esterase/lipase
VPVEDCYAGLVWTHEHAWELGLDPQRILVAGASAGGGISAGLTLMARDRKGPPIIGQILMGPMLDDRNETPSSYELIGEGIWDRTSNETGWDCLLGDRRGRVEVSPYAAPSRATDLTDLPAAYIDVGSAEMFRDEAVDYAVRLWRAGTQAELHVWPGGFHAFEMLAPHAALSIVSTRTRAAWVGRLLSADWSGRTVRTS